MADLRPLHEWTGAPAALTLWQPSADAHARARNAPVSQVPPSYEQEQHLRAFEACQMRQEEMARLLIVVWEEAGKCDQRAMGHVIAAHLRRHDTYHSWFKKRGADIVRHVLCDPSDIEIAPTHVGAVTPIQWHQHVMATPSPFAWDCFRFGVLQRANGFTFFASVDHLHADASVIAFLMDEIHSAYQAMCDGEAPRPQATAGRYLDYCAAQRRRAATTQLAGADVSDWVDFLHRNGGRMPPFPLPLGVLEDRCLTEHTHVDILNPEDMAAFELACHGAGARVIGGLFACAALTEQRLAATGRYSVITPTTTRRSSLEFAMSGWCMGVVPIDFDVGEGGFADFAKAGQKVFDARLGLAEVPIELVLELATKVPSIRPVATGGVMLSYIDTNLPPMGAHMAGDWHRLQGRVYINQGMSAQVALWFFKTQRGLALTAAYPSNETARATMQRYVETFRAKCLAASGGSALAPSTIGPVSCAKPQKHQPGYP